MNATTNPRPAVPYLSYDPDTAGAPSSITVILSGQPMSMASTDPAYEYTRERLFAGADEHELLSLFRPVTQVGERLMRLSENISFDGENILYDNDPIDAGISRHLRRVLGREGIGRPEAYMPTVRLLEKLYQNPSARSRKSLYDFLRRFDFTITPDGNFIGYKGVREDFTSIHSGPGIVDGVPMHGHLPNRPGSVLEVARSYVNADPDQGCSTGLHVGTYDYAHGFSQGGLLVVSVNPRDVVSVPRDSNFQKVRACRYTVLEATEHEYVEPLWLDDDFEADED